jgi:hypothetical protein
MRFVRALPATLVFSLILASCGVERAPPGPPHFDVAQCMAQLDRLGVKYRRLPDRDVGGGCVIRGAVQLLDIGVPVTNLGALACPVARQLTMWARDDVQKSALAHFGSPITRIESYGTYNCRPVDDVAGARVSEHGYANATGAAPIPMRSSSCAKRMTPAAAASRSCWGRMPTPTMPIIFISIWAVGIIAAKARVL